MTQNIDPAIAEVRMDPFSAEVLRHPYPFHDALREAGAVVWLPAYSIFATGRYSEAREVLMDWRTFCSSAGVGITNFRKEPPWREPSVVVEADPPLHTRTRGVLTRILAPRELRKLQEFFQREAEVLVARLVARGEFDGVADLAEPYPVKVFSDAMGLTEEGRHENLLAYSNIGFNAFGPRNALFNEAVEGAAGAVEWVMANCRRAALSPGGLGAKIYEAVDTGELTEHEAFLIVRGFLTAGMDTTIAGLSSTLFCLAQDSAQWELLRSNPSLAPAAFEEALRFEAPIQTLFRTTTRDVEIAGLTLKEGEKILVSLGAANRDPRKWQAPAHYDMQRRSGGHVGFGAGIHGCVGQIIARLESEAILSAFAKQVWHIELAGDPAIRLNNTLRGFSRIPLRIRGPI
jgi:cytochrome P450